MEHRYRIGKAALSLEAGNIVQEYTDAMASSAHPALAGTTGIDAVIHRAAGPEIRAACDEALKAFPGGVPSGQAAVTRAFRLRNKYLIHCVAPRYGDDNAPALLAACYRRALEICREHKLRTIAFPALGTGSHGFPLPEAARIALTTLREDLAKNAAPGSVRILFASERALAAFVAEADATLQKEAETSVY